MAESKESTLWLWLARLCVALAIIVMGYQMLDSWFGIAYATFVSTVLTVGFQLTIMSALIWVLIQLFQIKD